MKHRELWHAIEMCAHNNAMSCSRLAIVSGLSPPTFNKSKRCDKSGKPRWPSLYSISKMLNATNTSWFEFIKMWRGSKTK